MWCCYEPDCTMVYFRHEYVDYEILYLSMCSLQHILSKPPPPNSPAAFKRKKMSRHSQGDDSLIKASKPTLSVCTGLVVLKWINYQRWGGNHIRSSSQGWLMSKHCNINVLCSFTLDTSMLTISCHQTSLTYS